MALTAATLNELATLLKSRLERVSLHTQDPGPNGVLSELAGGTYARKTPVWAGPVNGLLTMDPLLIDVPSGPTTVRYYGFWSADGTFRGAYALPLPELFAGAGVYELVSVSIPVIG